MRFIAVVALLSAALTACGSADRNALSAGLNVSSGGVSVPSGSLLALRQADAVFRLGPGFSDNGPLQSVDAIIKIHHGAMAFCDLDSGIYVCEWRTIVPSGVSAFGISLERGNGLSMVYGLETRSKPLSVKGHTFEPNALLLETGSFRAGEAVGRSDYWNLVYVSNGSSIKTKDIAIDPGSAPVADGSNNSSPPLSPDQTPPLDVRVSVEHDTMGTTYNGNVAVGPGLAMSWNEVRLRARVDQVTVEELEVNRGNCVPPKGSLNLPRTLEFGQQLEIPFYDCDVIEVSVRTNEGAWTSSFQ